MSHARHRYNTARSPRETPYHCSELDPPQKMTLQAPAGSRWRVSSQDA